MSGSMQRSSNEGMYLFLFCMPILMWVALATQPELVPQIVFSYRVSYGVGKGALPPLPLRASLVLSLSCAQAAGTVRVTSLPST